MAKVISLPAKSKAKVTKKAKTAAPIKHKRTVPFGVVAWKVMQFHEAVRSFRDFIFELPEDEKQSVPENHRTLSAIDLARTCLDGLEDQINRLTKS